MTTTTAAAAAKPIITEHRNPNTMEEKIQCSTPLAKDKSTWRNAKKKNRTPWSACSVGRSYAVAQWHTLRSATLVEIVMYVYIRIRPSRRQCTDFREKLTFGAEKL